MERISKRSGDSVPACAFWTLSGRCFGHMSELWTLGLQLRGSCRAPPYAPPRPKARVLQRDRKEFAQSSFVALPNARAGDGGLVGGKGGQTHLRVFSGFAQRLCGPAWSAQ